MKWRLGKGFIIVLFFVIIAAGAVGVIQTQKQKPTPIADGARPAPFFALPTPKPLETNVHAADGTMKLNMRTQKQADGTFLYSFTSTDISGNNEKLIFTKNIAPGGSMSIPANAWSPDNKLVFIEEQEPATQAGTPAFFHVLALKASGEPFSTGDQYFDIPPLFAQRVKNYTFVKATGWASPTLIILNTAKEDGEKGPSFWFEIPSKAFLQLAR